MYKDSSKIIQGNEKISLFLCTQNIKTIQTTCDYFDNNNERTDGNDAKYIVRIRIQDVRYRIHYIDQKQAHIIQNTNKCYYNAD